MKIGIVLGTRPQIIKLGPFIRLLDRAMVDYFVIDTGQHVREDMNAQFYDELEMDRPEYFLDYIDFKNVGPVIREILQKCEPDLVVVQGDTDSALVGTVAALSLGIPVGHTEAGLRSNDLGMKEERNRIFIDHAARFLFCPHHWAVKNLFEEKVAGKIEVVGHLIAQAVKHVYDFRARPMKTDCILLTMHRPETVDNFEHLESIFRAIERLPFKVIFPIHPRTRDRLDHFQFNKYSLAGKLPENLIIQDPVGYRDMLDLIFASKLVLTDSGGIQEEACILGTPCVTLRESTERPETVEVGANMVAGYETSLILESVGTMAGNIPKWRNPYGDQAAEKILQIIQGEFNGIRAVN